MHHHHAPASDRAKQGSADTLAPLCADLEQSATHGAGMRQSQVGAVLDHPYDDASISCADTFRPLIYFALQADIEIVDVAAHAMDYIKNDMGEQACRRALQPTARRTMRAIKMNAGRRMQGHQGPNGEF